MNYFSSQDWIALSRETYGLHLYYLAQFNEIQLKAFRRTFLPYLTEGECQAMRDVIRPDLDAPSLPANPYTGFPLVYYLAAALGMHDEVYRILQLIPNGQYGTPDYFDGYHRPQLLVLGLGSPWLVEKEVRRLKLCSRNQMTFAAGSPTPRTPPWTWFATAFWPQQEGRVQGAH